MFDLGAKPFSRPIRKKAFHRAYKRGDLWVILPYNFPHKILTEFGHNRIITDINCPENVAYITWPLTTIY